MRQALDEGVHQVADTVRNSLNFYRMQESAETVERAVLTGPAVAIPGFAEQLAEQLAPAGRVRRRRDRRGGRRRRPPDRRRRPRARRHARSAGHGTMIGVTTALARPWPGSSD